jgi:hypothetical protein
VLQNSVVGAVSPTEMLGRLNTDQIPAPSPRIGLISAKRTQDVGLSVGLQYDAWENSRSINILDTDNGGRKGIEIQPSLLLDH